MSLFPRNPDNHFFRVRTAAIQAALDAEACALCRHHWHHDLDKRRRSVIVDIHSTRPRHSRPRRLSVNTTHTLHPGCSRQQPRSRKRAAAESAHCLVGSFSFGGWSRRYRPRIYAVAAQVCVVTGQTVGPIRNKCRSGSAFSHQFPQQRLCNRPRFPGRADSMLFHVLDVIDFILPLVHQDTNPRLRLLRLFSDSLLNTAPPS